jgi:hypothetical protein
MTSATLSVRFAVGVQFWIVEAQDFQTAERYGRQQAGKVGGEVVNAWPTTPVDTTAWSEDSRYPALRSQPMWERLTVPYGWAENVVITDNEEA